jgi:seryl-tRNA synthetase
MFGTAQLPKFRDDQFAAAAAADDGAIYQRIRAQAVDLAVKELNKPAAELQLDDLLVFELRVLDDAVPPANFWLIPTAEVPLTNLVREQILDV